MTDFDNGANFANGVIQAITDVGGGEYDVTLLADAYALFDDAPFNCTCWLTERSHDNAEIVRVISKDDGAHKLRITRAEEDSVLQGIEAGWFIGNTQTRKVITDIQDAIASATGGIIGTSFLTLSAQSESSSAHSIPPGGSAFVSFITPSDPPPVVSLGSDISFDEGTDPTVINILTDGVYQVVTNIYVESDDCTPGDGIQVVVENAGPTTLPDLVYAGGAFGFVTGTTYIAFGAFTTAPLQLVNGDQLKVLVDAFTQSTMHWNIQGGNVSVIRLA